MTKLTENELNDAIAIADDLIRKRHSALQSLLNTRSSKLDYLPKRDSMREHREAIDILKKLADIIAAHRAKLLKHAQTEVSAEFSAVP